MDNLGLRVCFCTGAGDCCRLFSGKSQVFSQA